MTTTRYNNFSPNYSIYADPSIWSIPSDPSQRLHPGGSVPTVSKDRIIAREDPGEQSSGCWILLSSGCWILLSSGCWILLQQRTPERRRRVPCLPSQHGEEEQFQRFENNSLVSLEISQIWIHSPAQSLNKWSNLFSNSKLYYSIVIQTF
jgi:hypothetical protein